MRKKFTLSTGCFLFAIFFCSCAVGQNSALINFGSTACNNSVPSFSLIKAPLSESPVTLTTCDMSAQLPDYFSVFVSYNPLNNKVYIADTRTGVRTDIWQLDMGLPATIACPATIPLVPDYSYPYVSNNFEFDKDGNLWSLSGYNLTAGQCNIDRFDVNTGNVISSKTIQFPENHFPTTIFSGDLTLLPNGRMFAVLGNGTCQLYEITNYANGTGNATATYLLTLPRDCYGITFLNGFLELTGLDFAGGCYYYDYDIASGVLGVEKPFQNGQAPIDNTSFTPQIGCTKRLLCATRINANTADLIYELYIENTGNVILNNVGLVDNLAAAFGAGNVSNVRVSVVPGSNAANLALNPSYNGITVTNVLNPGQNLPNRILDNSNYFLKLQLHLRATNLCNNTYRNSAIASANIGAGIAGTILNVSDSSNNGDPSAIDPNHNNRPGEVNENRPTPFNMSVLPVKFLNVNAVLEKNNAALIKWQVAVPMDAAEKFEIEFSTDGKYWGNAGELKIENKDQSSWQYMDENVPAGNLYYRIKQTDNDGTFTYSRIVLLKNKNNGGEYMVYPNPANSFIAISSGYNGTIKTMAELYDATGRLLLTKIIVASNEEISTAQYPQGTYLLRLLNNGNVVTYKVLVKH